MLLAAVSDRSRGLRTEDVDVEGAVPDLTDLGSGCPFAPRYKHVMDVCHQAMPEPTQFEDERWVRCYLYEEGVSVMEFRFATAVFSHFPTPISVPSVPPWLK